MRGSEPWCHWYGSESDRPTCVEKQRTRGETGWYGSKEENTGVW